MNLHIVATIRKNSETRLEVNPLESGSYELAEVMVWVTDPDSGRIRALQRFHLARTSRNKIATKKYSTVILFSETISYIQSLEALFNIVITRM